MPLPFSNQLDSTHWILSTWTLPDRLHAAAPQQWKGTGPGVRPMWLPDMAPSLPPEGPTSKLLPDSRPQFPLLCNGDKSDYSQLWSHWEAQTTAETRLNQMNVLTKSKYGFDGSAELRLTK